MNPAEQKAHRTALRDLEQAFEGFAEQAIAQLTAHAEGLKALQRELHAVRNELWIEHDATHDLAITTNVKFRGFYDRSVWERLRWLVTGQ